MAGTRKTRKQIQQEMDALKAQLKEASEREEQVFGRLARKTGVFDLDLSEDQMVEALTDMVSRFRPSDTAQANATATDRDQDQSTATADGAGG